MKYIVSFLLFLLIIILFRSWFSYGVIAGGDLPYYFPQMIHDITFLSSWDVRNFGMGGSMLPTLWIEMYTTATLKIFHFLPWETYLRIFWLFPFLIFSLGSSFFLSKWYFRNGLFNLFASFIYICNSYALLLVGGGQTGVALSYSLVPLGLLVFENLLRRQTLKSAVIFSLVFSTVFLLDIRIGYILFWILGIRFIFEIFPTTKEKIKKYFILFPVSGLCIIGIHAFWLLPTLFTHGVAIQQFGDIYTSRGAVLFFSFAKFENALGLLHPNWPENLFGKTYFMRTEFLLLPIFAFSSLFFVSKKRPEGNYISFFALLGLVGIFLAKGANDPFGSIYLWLFGRVPGFIMFRDPTKWYVLIVLSYAILIPFSLQKIYIFLQSQTKFPVKSKIFNFQNTFIMCFIFYILLLIRPALLGQLNGTLKSHTIPNEYIKLEKFLNNQNNFSRTLWIPETQTFGFHSEAHPAVSAYDFFNVASISRVLETLHRENEEEKLLDSSIRYVIVPYDSEGKIFLKDRTYNNSIYNRTVGDVKSVSWLKQVSGFGKIIVFKLSNPKDRFWSSGKVKISYSFNNPTDYLVEIKNANIKDRIVFTDSFDPFWVARTGSMKIFSEKYEGMNSFILPKDGSYTLRVSYQPQMWVNTGIWVSLITLCLTLGTLSWFGARKLLQ